MHINDEGGSVLTEWSEITTISRRAVQVLDAHGRNMTGRDGRDWEATHYRTHTLGEVRDLGAQMIGHEVTVAGYAEAVRGRGAICLPGCFAMELVTSKPFLKKDNMDEESFDAIQSASRESTIQVTGTVAQKRPPKVPEGEPEPPAEYEINVTSGQILALAETPLPVGVTDDVHVGLDVRLDNRHSQISSRARECNVSTPRKSVAIRP